MDNLIIKAGRKYKGSDGEDHWTNTIIGTMIPQKDGSFRIILNFVPVTDHVITAWPKDEREQ